MWCGCVRVHILLAVYMNFECVNTHVYTIRIATYHPSATLGQPLLHWHWQFALKTTYKQYACVHNHTMHFV